MEFILENGKKHKFDGNWFLNINGIQAGISSVGQRYGPTTHLSM